MGRPRAVSCSSFALVVAVIGLLVPSAAGAQTLTTAEPLDREDRVESGEPPKGTPLFVALTGRLVFGAGATQEGFVIAIGGSFERFAGPRKLKPPSEAERRSTDDGFDAFEDPADAEPRRRKRDIDLATDVEGEGEPGAVAHVADGAFARGLVRAVLRASKQDKKRERLDALATRAKTSALLPEVRVRVGRNVDQAIALIPSATDPLRTTASDGDKLLVEGRATFRLDRLVFAEEEVQVEKLRLEREHQEKALVEEVLRDLAAWQRAELASHDPALTGEAAIDNEVARISTVEALDVLSDGWFSAHANKLRPAVGPEMTKARSPGEPPKERAHASGMVAAGDVAASDLSSASWEREAGHPAAAP